MKNKMNLSPKTKELMHSVMDGNLAVVPILHQLSHYRDVDKFLVWLNRNNIKGQNLIEFLKFEHQNSVMGMVKFIVKSHNKNRDLKPIVIGRDWIK